MFTNVQRHVTSSYLGYFYSIGCRIVNWVTADGCVHIAEFVGSRRELVANSCTHRRRNATRQFRRVGVGGVYLDISCILVSHDSKLRLFVMPVKCVIVQKSY